jgi:UDP-N-acetylglucosamine acyltransferase
MSIHPTAIVSSTAKIGADCVVGPYCIIGDKVSIADNCKLHSHVVVQGNTTIGEGTEIFPFASVGNKPQDLKFKGEDSLLIIGKNNIIREYVTLQPGTSGGGMKTTVGDQNLFMANSHLGHDSSIGSGNIIANSVAIAGHVTIGNRVTIGGLCGIHQFVKIGDYAMVAAGAMVTQDLPHACMAHGNRACLVGINTIGLKRAGFSEEDIQAVRTLYRNIFLKTGTLKEKIQLAKEGNNNAPQIVQDFIAFISSSNRGIAPASGKKGASSGNTESDTI